MKIKDFKGSWNSRHKSPEVGKSLMLYRGISGSQCG